MVSGFQKDQGCDGGSNDEASSYGTQLAGAWLAIKEGTREKRHFHEQGAWV